MTDIIGNLECGIEIKKCSECEYKLRCDECVHKLDNTSIKKALEYIKGYCNKHYDCDSCKLADKNEQCFLRNQNEPPADWDIDEILRKEGEKKK